MMRTRFPALLVTTTLCGIGLAYAANNFRTPTGEEVPGHVQMCLDVNNAAVPCNDAAASGGGGPVSVANGADVAEGNTAATAWSGSGAGTVISILKAIYAAIGSQIPAGTNTIGAINPLVGTYTDRSGSIATGGTHQTLTAANATRRRIIIQNPCTATSQGIATAENLFINWTSAASPTAASVELLPCGSYDSDQGPVSTELIDVVAATTAHKYTAKEM